ncbi:MAG: aminotransferase class I/II-fold pyridoxal phosphate-dependent enzyme [Planctomycetes bacterium]|nr:aminotransferase class I/II-fold pyridoxal phosphate-dependent enzyme [Planctomycetota bacterium]
MSARNLVASHMKTIDVSGIRRVFELGATLTDPINLSIGQPDYDVPDNVKEAMIEAVRNGQNGYTVTRGLPELRERIQADVINRCGGSPDVLVTSGVSGGLFLALMACLDRGDEVLIGDPYFVSYPYLVQLSGGTAVRVDLYDDFQLHPERFAARVGERTKILIVCSPGNPTGVVYAEDDLRAIAELARERDLLILSDEIYVPLTYDDAPPSVFQFAPERTIILGGFGKAYGMTGWRMGYAAGPAEIIDEMAKLQQYTFVCAPHPAQHATITAMDTDMSDRVNEYRAKRDLVCAELEGVMDFVRPGGGFYVFPAVPSRFANASALVDEAVRRNVLVIPGGVFSERDTHFRISFAAPNDKIRRGCEILRSM